MIAMRFAPRSVVLLGLLSISATRLVALRVDVEPLRAIGGETVVAVEVRIAPGDRARIGDRAWVEIVLARDGGVVDRVARAVRLGADGEARVEVAWPPGRYELRVDVGGAAGDERGVWEGSVEVPELAPGVREPPEGVAPGEPREIAGVDPVEAEPPTSEPVAAEPPVPSAEEGRRISPPAPVEPDSVPPEPVAPAPSTGGTRSQAEIATGDPVAPGIRELTIVAVDGTRPVEGLLRSSFELRVDGDEVALSGFGNAATTPLWLGLAVDLSPSIASYLPELRRELGRLALRAQAHGATMVTTSADGPTLLEPWSADPEAVGRALATTARDDSVDLAGLVTAALERFDERSGRRFLLVVSDGGDTAPGDAWDRATAAAERAAVPVLVVGFRGEELDRKTQRRLEGLADSTGGTSYLLRDTELLARVTGYLGDLMEAGYVLVFPAPPPGEHRVRIRSADRDLEVWHPERIR